MSARKSPRSSRSEKPATCTSRRDADLIDYWTGELRGAAASVFEEHLFTCDACARRLAELDALVRGIGGAVRAGGLATVIDDSVLNKMARDGVRVRSFIVAPGETVPCAVWEGDEVMALRLRGNFKGLRQVTVVQRVGGETLVRDANVPVGGRSEIVLALPAAVVRETPAAQVDIRVTGRARGTRRFVGVYTLHHGGTLARGSH